MLTIAALTVAACGPKSDIEGFTKTKSGLHYKFEKENKDAQQIQVGDAIVGEVTMWFENDTLFSNSGEPQRVIRVGQSMFNGDINEGLLLMHNGDEAIFAVDCDSMATMFTQMEMPPNYKPGTKQKLYYRVKVVDIVSAAEVAQEDANYQAEMDERRNQEPQLIAEYVAKNNIKVQPTDEGLYVIVTKKGNGKKVETGKKVTMNYVGRLLDGSLFDTSVKSVAEEANKVQMGRPYEPMTYIVGQQPLIKGWEQAVMGQPAGTKLTVIIPSSLGYGSHAMGNEIPAFSTLVFDIDILSVE